MTKPDEIKKSHWWVEDRKADSCAIHLTPGSNCPACEIGTLGYDGLFILSCHDCGYVASSGAFT